ncbi:MAG: hypothetical protein AAGJ83_06990 [Planctomycetota bacterium]
MPKLSLLHLIGVVTISALAMGVMQQAVTNPSVWSVLLSVILIAMVLPAVFWIATYCIAHLLSALGGTVVRESLVVEYRPSTRMPADRSESLGARDGVGANGPTRDLDRPVGLSVDATSAVDVPTGTTDEDR